MTPDAPLTPPADTALSHDAPGVTSRLRDALRARSLSATVGALVRAPEWFGDRGGIARRGLVVLLAHDRVVVARVGLGDAEPCAECLARHALDGESFPDLPGLREHLETHGLRPLAPVPIGLVVALAEEATPGGAFELDLLTREVRPVVPVHHPWCGAPWHRFTRLAGGRLGLRPVTVGPSLRQGGPPELDDLTRSLGLIRSEKTLVNTSGTVTHVTELVLNEAQGKDYCAGVSRRYETARRTSRCEALERHLFHCEPEDSTTEVFPYEEAPRHAVDPSRLVVSIRNPRPGATLYDPSLPLAWTPAYSVTEDTERLVPSQLVWGRRRRPGVALSVSTTTSGCALGWGVEEAALQAVLELVERDGFVLSWYLRRSCRRVDPASVDDPGFHALLAGMRVRHPSYGFHFLDTMTEFGVPSVWLLAVREGGEGEKTFTCGAADLSVGGAMRSSLRELSGIMEKNAGRDPADTTGAELWVHPERIRSPSDHAAVYGADEAFGAFDFLDLSASPVTASSVQSRAVIPLSDTYDLGGVLEALGSHLGGLGSELVLKDLTLRHVEARGLYCVRAFMLDAFPLAFGYHRQRLALTDRLRRVAAQETGAADIALEDLAPHLHPLA